MFGKFSFSTRYDGNVLIFNLLRQNAMFARFRSSPLEFHDQHSFVSTLVILPRLFELSTKTLDQDLTMTIVFDECKEMSDDPLKRIHRTDSSHRQSRDDIRQNIEQSETSLTQREFIKEVLGNTGDRWMRMKQTQCDLTDVTTNLKKFNRRYDLRDHFLLLWSFPSGSVWRWSTAPFHWHSNLDREFERRIAEWTARWYSDG